MTAKKPAATTSKALEKESAPSPSPHLKEALRPAPPFPSRVVIENVRPEIDGGQFAVKRVEGESVSVSADILVDGHDSLAARLLHRAIDEERWTESPLAAEGNDRWTGSFRVVERGRYEFTVEAWVDRFATWRRDLEKKAAADQSVESDLKEGAELVRKASERARGEDVLTLTKSAEVLASGAPLSDRLERALDAELARLLERYPDRSRAFRFPRSLPVLVERERARFGAWYEMFPRSSGSEERRGASFEEAEKRLAEIAAMGFDVLYLPPIHPIGATHRKGRNNTLIAEETDPGSPWAIGAKEGGHKAVEPGLGTLHDFDRFRARAAELGLEIALDLAFQCSPDHPYVSEHPEWFSHRPDGTIKYAENPPKKYQDIYPFDFESEHWVSLWQELKEVVLFWAGRGVRIFRVDNPHTKPFPFWEWLIGEVRRGYPDVIFLSEAFTRPKVMRRLAKIGFSQSYTYFTWRNTKRELTDYFTELTATEVREYMRGNLFANTPDILHEYLQFGGRSAFQIRLVLAATLGASYGIYGPAFELCENRAVPNSEEYQDSEKYQVRAWDRDRPGDIRDFIARVNRIRRENPCLHSDWSLRFHPVENDRLLCFSKKTEDLENVLLMVVNLDPHHPQEGRLRLPLAELGLMEDELYQMHDLLGDARFVWQGEANFVRLLPSESPAYIFRMRRKIRTERDFDYYL
jgi:starch synthase (maltosyl-transferring)